MNFTTYSIIVVLLGMVMGFCICKIIVINQLNDVTYYVEERLVDFTNICKHNYNQDVLVKRLSYPVYEITFLEDKNETQ